MNEFLIIAIEMLLNIAYIAAFVAGTQAMMALGYIIADHCKEYSIRDCLYFLNNILQPFAIFAWGYLIVITIILSKVIYTLSAL